MKKQRKNNRDRGVSVKLKRDIYLLLRKLATDERRTMTAVLTAALRIYEVESGREAEMANGR